MELNTYKTPRPALRPYQTAALDAARVHLREGRRSVLIQLPTGTGKTRTAMEACRSHIEKGGRVLWVAPRRELLSQANGVLGEAGVRCWVRSIQELSVEGAEVPDATMVVLDEARHYLSDRWSALRAVLPKALVLGLDATPERGDARGMGGMFDALVVGISIAQAVKDGWLVPAEVIRPDRALESGEIAQAPADAYCDYALGTKAILFAPRVELAIQYACDLRGRGISSLAVWGDMPSRQRSEALEAFASGDVQVLCNQNLLVEGFDLPSVETVILARRFGTQGGYLQAVGRGLRPSAGKAKCMVLDLLGISHVFGEPDAERTYHLDGKAIRLKDDGPDVRFCPLCGQPTETTACDVCGYEGAMRLRKPRVLGLPMTRFASLRAEDEMRRAERLSNWMQFARSKGWREGQAFHRYRGAFGEMPSRVVIARARLLTPR